MSNIDQALLDIEDIATGLKYASNHPGFIDCLLLGQAAIRLQQAVEMLKPKPRQNLQQVVIQGWLDKGFAVEIKGAPVNGNYRLTAEPKQK